MVIYTMNPNLHSESEATKSSTDVKLGIKRRIINRNFNFNFTGIPDTQCFALEHTPTPTRFIRNCEEVGLFQDLQNVNPFEEGFRKALSDCAITNKETPASSSTYNNDDTLHTPNILPLICNSYALTNIKESHKVIALDKSSSDDDNSEFNLKLIHHQKPTSQNEFVPDSLTSLTTNKQHKQDPVEKETLILSSIEKRRESNRNAARRAYKRRVQIALDKEKETESLRKENLKLKQENASLIMEVKNLRRVLRSISSSITVEQHKIAPDKCSDVIQGDKVETVSVPSTKCRFLLPKPPKLPIYTIPALKQSQKVEVEHKNIKSLRVSTSKPL